jgi:uncharacterized protein YcbX/ferredoxin
MELTQLFSYPLKSGRGIRYQMAELGYRGLRYDRHWLVTDRSGQFVTARTHPQMCLIRVQLHQQSLALEAPGMAPLELSFKEFGHQRMPVVVWKDSIDAAQAPQAGHQWVSDYLKGDYRLVYMDDQAQRLVRHHEEHQVGFADGFPLLLISHQSLEALDQRAGRKFEMERFRPNLVVNADKPFAEDSWKRVRIGDVELMQAKPCSRCVFTTIDPQTGIVDREGEPLKSLSAWRQSARGEILFGQNMVATKLGVIRCGDLVEVLEWHEPEPLGIQFAGKGKLAKSTPKPFTILHDGYGVSFEADPTLSVLQNAEQSGVPLPSSCRAGLCGRCRIVIESGEVDIRRDDALTEQEKQQGIALACSCFPRSDLVINGV